MYNKLSHALRHANRLEARYRNAQSKPHGKRRPYFIRVFAKYLIDRKLEHWYLGDMVCFRYRGRVLWVFPPQDGYTKVFLNTKSAKPHLNTNDLHLQIKGVRVSVVVENLAKRGLL